MTWDEEHIIKRLSSKEYSGQTSNEPTRIGGCDLNYDTGCGMDYGGNKNALIETPRKLVEEIKILATGSNPRTACYLLFAEKPSGVIRVDGYTRISRNYNYTSYDVNEVLKLVKAGRIPVLMIQVRTGKVRPTAKDIMTWWINDHALGFPLNHALLSVDKGKVEFKVFNLRECFFCEKKSEPLKSLEL
jgi:hypothetical protein